MGKDSLIKSTAKKSAKKEEKVKKTTARKKTAKKETPKKSTKTPAKVKKTTVKKKSTAKAAPKKKAVAAKPKPKKTAKQKPKTTTKRKSTAKKTTKKLTVKELLLKSFDPISKIDKPKAAAPSKRSLPSAPPIINAADPQESARVRKLLFQTYDMADIKAAAKSSAVESHDAVPPNAQPQGETTPEHGDNATHAPHSDTFEGVPTSESDANGFSKGVKRFAICVGAVILLLLMVSYTNSSKFYVEPKDNAVEIWKGRFSPKDKRFYMVLHGTQLLGKAKDVYSREEVFPMIFEYYLGKADTLLEVPGLPDFEGIKTYLKDASGYALSNDKRKRVADRLYNIDRMILLYKADVSISQGTLKSLDAAIKHLNSAQVLITNTAQEQEIRQKIDLAKSLKAALKAKAGKKTK